MRGWLVIVTVITASARPADACSFNVPEPYEVVPGADDVPPTVTRDDVSVSAFEEKACAMSQTSCDGSGSVHVAIEGSDDVTPPLELGFVVRVVESRAQAVRIDPGPFEVSTGLIFSFDPDAELDLVLGIRTVDRAGNMSEEERLVTVTHEPERVSCGVSGRGRGALAPLVVAALVLTACRTRTRGWFRRG